VHAARADRRRLRRRVDAVHDARVATRRIRELLARIPVIPKLLGWEGCAEAESRLDAAVIAPAR
jgi:hypothetical protein